MLNPYIIFTIILLIIIVICCIESSLNKKNIKFIFKTPKTYFTEIKNYNGQTLEFLIYNKKWYDQNKSIINTDSYFKVKPQITILDRFKINLRNMKKKDLNLNSFFSSVTDKIIPFILSLTDLLTTNLDSKYRILYKNINNKITPLINSTSDENIIKIY